MSFKPQSNRSIYSDNTLPERAKAYADELVAYQIRPPTNEVELYNYVWRVLGVKIPTAQVCPNCVAPWTAFKAAYFAESPVQVWRASRSGGKTFMLALLALTELLTLNAFVVLLGGSLEQSIRVHDYINGKDPSSKGKFLESKSAPSWMLDGEPTATRTKLVAGGKLIALTASDKSVRGLHPSRLRLDECLERNSSIPVYDKTTGMLTYKTISNILPGDEVVSWNGADFVKGLVTDVVCKGIRPTYNVELSNGRTLRATGNHPVLTRKGWKSVDELQENEEILSFVQRMPNTHEICSPRETWVYRNVQTVLESDARSRGPQVYGLWDKSQNKELHQSVWHNQTAGTLRSLLQKERVGGAKVVSDVPDSCNKTSYNLQTVLSQEKGQTNGPLSGLWEVNNIFLYTVQTLFYEAPRFGRISISQGRRSFRSKPDVFDKWTSFYMGRSLEGETRPVQLGIQETGKHREIYSRFCDNKSCSAFYRGNVSRSYELPKQEKRLGNQENVLCQRGVSDGSICRIKFQDQEVGRATENIIQPREYTTVTRITRAEPGEVWDITVDKYHNFIAEGVVVHNCDAMDLKIYGPAMAMPKPFRQKGKLIIPVNTVLSSTHNVTGGTFSYVMEEAKEKGWPFYSWCWRETLAPHGWMEQEDITALRSAIPKHIWEREMEHREPKAEDAIFDPELVHERFSKEEGDFDGEVNEECVIELPDGYSEYYHGVDLAKSKDSTIILTFKRSIEDGIPDLCVAYKRMQRTSYVYIAREIDKRVEEYGGHCVYDGGGPGKVVEDMLSCDAEKFEFSDKKEGVNVLANYVEAFEQGLVKFPMITYMWKEHLSLTFQMLYGGSNHHLPDTICAAALAWRARSSTGDVFIGRLNMR